LLYRILKIIARLALPFFCRKIVINRASLLKIKGPVLLAANHPNSFLDSIILDTLFQQPLWSLARGDVFKKSFLTALQALKILPVYRTSEGVENLSENYKTFEACVTILKNNGIITIFSEGKCVNEWHLRPLKKGTARLAIKAWEENINLKVLPVSINYSSFSRFGKNVFINFGDFIEADKINMRDKDGEKHKLFNQLLQEQLESGVFEIEKKDKQRQKEILTLIPSRTKKILLSIPAGIGFLLHAPLYLPVKSYVWKRTYKNDHYDSVLTALLLFTYPLYLLVIFLLVWLSVSFCWAFAVFILFPFTAWCYIQLKPQLDKQVA